ncbi:MAG: RnfABCDGE type electron transport complex subunit D [Spirochaetaceae bacterium]|jgi:electron transport complex protein RnfD|nr:RnfABCDGE type electron transport complex subunit D [Spirochaetaceae bacterium]
MKASYHNIAMSSYLYNKPSVSRSSLYILLALLPQLIMLAVTASYRSLIIIACTCAGFVLAEFLGNALRKKQTLNDGTALVAGLLTGMFFPAEFSFVMAFCITFGTALLTKQLFGSGGCCWINPVMTAVVLAYFHAPLFFPYLVTPAGVDLAGTPFAAASGVFTAAAPDAAITTGLNSGFLQRLGIFLPDGYVTLFRDTGASIPALRFNLLTLAASVFLIACGTLNWRLPACYLFMYGLLVWVFSLYPFGGGFLHGDMLFALLTSGTLFCGFFILDYQGTVPLSPAGKAVYGLIAGFFAFIFSGAGGSPVGALFTVLAVNCVSPLIGLVEEWGFQEIRKKEMEQRILYGK